MLQLHVQQVEQCCLFDLSWGQGQRLSIQVPFPKTLISLYKEWHRTYLKFYQTLSVKKFEVTDNTLRGRVENSGKITSSITKWHSRLTQIETQLLNDFQQWLRIDKLYDIRATVSQVFQA